MERGEREREKRKRERERERERARGRERERARKARCKYDLTLQREAVFLSMVLLFVFYPSGAQDSKSGYSGYGG